MLSLLLHKWLIFWLAVFKFSFLSTKESCSPHACRMSGPFGDIRALQAKSTTCLQTTITLTQQQRHVASQPLQRGNIDVALEGLSVLTPKTGPAAFAFVSQDVELCGPAVVVPHDMPCLCLGCWQFGALSFAAPRVSWTCVTGGR